MRSTYEDLAEAIRRIAADAGPDGVTLNVLNSKLKDRGVPRTHAAEALRRAIGQYRVVDLNAAHRVVARS